MRGTLFVLTYIIVCLLYIFLSDSLLFWLTPDLAQTRLLQTLKGTIFVLVTAALMFWLIRQNNSRQSSATEEVAKSLRQVTEASTELKQALAEGEAARLALELRTEELKRSNEDLVQFAYVVSHDLREPLRMVSSYLQLLQKRYGDQLDNTAKEFIHFAVDGATRMQAQISSLLEYSRLNTHGKQFSTVDLNRVLEEVRQDLSLLLEERKADLRVETMPILQGDSSQLALLFKNLISNAIKHNNSDPPRISVACEDWGESVRILVADNGEGFDPKFADRVFEIYQRLKRNHEGTGIGLALCKRIVQRHRGQIGVETQPGEGATFWIVLPKNGKADTARAS